MNVSLQNPALTLAAPAAGAGLMVMKKALDTYRQEGRNMASLLAKAAPPAPAPNLGTRLDIRV